jgi:hypothetical protein
MDKAFPVVAFALVIFNALTIGFVVMMGATGY